jgi:hypothetical protein
MRGLSSTSGVSWWSEALELRVMASVALNAATPVTVASARGRLNRFPMPLVLLETPDLSGTHQLD